MDEGLSTAPVSLSWSVDHFEVETIVGDTTYTGNGNTPLEAMVDALSKAYPGRAVIMDPKAELAASLNGLTTTDPRVAFQKRRARTPRKELTQ